METETSGQDDPGLYTHAGAKNVHLPETSVTSYQFICASVAAWDELAAMSMAPAGEHMQEIIMSKMIKSNIIMFCGLFQLTHVLVAVTRRAALGKDQDEFA